MPRPKKAHDWAILFVISKFKEFTLGYEAKLWKIWSGTNVSSSPNHFFFTITLSFVNIMYIKSYVESKNYVYMFQGKRKGMQKVME